MRRSVEWVDVQKKKCPLVEPLVLVLKQFLVDKSFSESFSGGLPSYALIIMVVHFIQKFPLFADSGLGLCFVQFLR
jgi:DNA polymerase sigma